MWLQEGGKKRSLTFLVPGCAHFHFGGAMPSTLQNAGLPRSLHRSLVSRAVGGTRFSFSAMSPRPTVAFPTQKYLLSETLHYLRQSPCQPHFPAVQAVHWEHTGIPQQSQETSDNRSHLNIDPHVHQLWHQSTPWWGSWIFLLSVHPLKSPYLLDLLPVLNLPPTHKQCVLQRQHKSWSIAVRRQLQRNPSWAPSSKVRPATHSSLQPSPSKDRQSSTFLWDRQSETTNCSIKPSSHNIILIIVSTQAQEEFRCKQIHLGQITTWIFFALPDGAHKTPHKGMFSSCIFT